MGDKKNMSNTTKAPASDHSAEEKTNEKNALSHAQKSADARAKQLAQITKILVFGLLIGAWLIDKGAHSAHFAMLYLMADNGKKSGRADGNVYMRNGRIRGFKVPALVQNAYTQTQRSSLSALSAAFRVLTAGQIAAWNATRGFFTSDRFGRSVEMTGKTLFVSLNTNIFNIGGTLITDPPLAGAVNGITNLITVAPTAIAFPLSFSPAPTDASVTHLIYATIGMSAGVSKPSKSSFRLVSTLAPASTSPKNIFTPYSLKFGAPVVGQKYFVKLIPINTTTGQSGAAIVNSGLAV